MLAVVVGFSHKMNRLSAPGVVGSAQFSRTRCLAMYARLLAAAMAGSSFQYPGKSPHPRAPKCTVLTGAPSRVTNTAISFLSRRVLARNEASRGMTNIRIKIIPEHVN